MNKLCHNVSVVLSGNNIEFVHETKYLGVIINSSMKTSSDVVRQTRKFYAQTNMLLLNFCYCTNDVKCMLFKSFCANMYCCPLWFNSTSSSIKKLKTSYNSALRNLLLIKKPYSASTMFVTHVLYCIMRPYTAGRLERYRIGIPRELSEIRTQRYLAE